MKEVQVKELKPNGYYKSSYPDEKLIQFIYTDNLNVHFVGFILQEKYHKFTQEVSNNYTYPLEYYSKNCNQVIRNRIITEISREDFLLETL